MHNRDNYPGGRRPDEYSGGGRDQDRYGRRGEDPTWEQDGRYRRHMHDRGRDDGRNEGGRRGYGEASARGGYGEGGYPREGGYGGYGPRGSGSEDQRARGATPTYGDSQDQHLAQRSQWREDQRYGDHRSTGETWRRDDSQRDPDHGGVGRQAQGRPHDQDFEPHYRSWRDQQLSSHDQDYARWREHQAKRYDDEYRSWRDQRHESFSRDFHDWRSRQPADLGASAAARNSIGDSNASAANPTGASAAYGEMSGSGGGAVGASVGSTPGEVEQVQAVTDGHTRVHRDDEHKDGDTSQRL